MSASVFQGGRVLASACLAACLACAGDDAPRGRAPAAASTLPRRIVSLGPSLTEALVALGAMDRMVGRSRWDEWPDTVRTIPAIGDAIRPSAERIIASRPDLVLLYQAADNTATIAALRDAGIRVVALRIDTIEQFLAAVDTIGALIGAAARAESIGGTLRQELRAVRDASGAATPVRVFIPVWDEPLMTVGAGSFLSELVAIAGGRNVYADEPAPSLTIAMEDVIRRDPDVVLASPASVARIRKDARWRGVRAVRDGRVVAFDTTLVSQPSTRLGRAARSVAALLRPGSR
jgi:iron complex transport system substrate-binding protein